jgi:hypothetical protein
MYAPDDYPEPEPPFCDWKGNVLEKGSRVVLDVMPERVSNPRLYSGTILDVDFDDSGAYVVVLYEDGIRDILNAYYTRAHGEQAFEVSDLMVVGT